MSVLIKGMEMPSSCESCKLLREEFNFTSLDFDYFCQVTKFSIDRNFHNDQLGGKLDNCPLVEVPTPHGDLIDKDLLPEQFAYADYNFEMILEYSPPVIEAERI